MSEDKKTEVKTSASQNNEKAKTVSSSQNSTPPVKTDRSRGSNFGNRSNGRNRRGGRDNRNSDEFEQRILEISRVTRVMAGGKRMSFRACVAVGDKKGNVGVALGKGSDVTIAINKAVNRAKKDLVNVPIVKETIPHAILQKVGAAKIILKPAKAGRGIISGGVTRVILELSGIKNITTKNLGSKSKINNARCLIEALRNLRRREVKVVNSKDEKKKEGKEVKEEKKIDSRENKDNKENKAELKK